MKKPEGLKQKIKVKGKSVTLQSVLNDNDYWTLKKNGTGAFILTHDAVKKLADKAGIYTDVDYKILTQPTHENNYQQTWQARVTSDGKKFTSEIGEVNRNNLGPRGRNNPANMAQKRAYDRAVLRHLGIVGFLGEDELPEETEEKVENLSPDDAKAITPLLNEIFACKTRTELQTFSKKMEKLKVDYKPEQLEVLRIAWSNRLSQVVERF